MKRWTIVLTNSEDVTSDYLCDRLAAGGIQFYRLDTDRILETVSFDMDAKHCVLADGADFSVSPEDVAALILRRPKPLESRIEGDDYQKHHASAEWGETFEGFLSQVPVSRWINHPGQNFKASHKIEQLKRAAAVGLHVPMWTVTSRPESAAAFLEAVGPTLIAKPLSSGFIERDVPDRDTVIYTSEITDKHAALFERLPGCPVMLQESVRKTFDVRLVVVAGQMIAVTLQAQGDDGRQRLDIRRNAMSDVRYGVIDIPQSVRCGVAQLMEEYGLVFGALDFAITEQGEWVFFEINPNGQWAWLDLEAGTSIHNMFVEAISRMQ